MDIYEAITELKETRTSEDDYFQGAFWIKGKSLKDIKNGNFTLLIGSKILTDYYGEYDQTIPKRKLTHEKLWNQFNDVHSYTYYPRGRVAIDQGTAYVHLNSNCVTDKIKDAIVKEYEISKLRIVYDYNNEYQGSHYDFELR